MENILKYRYVYYLKVSHFFHFNVYNLLQAYKKDLLLHADKKAGVLASNYLKYLNN